MQKKFLTTYLIIFATLLIMMSLSRHSSEKIRGSSIALLAPVWEKILAYRHFLFHPLTPDPFSSLSVEEEKQHLLLENQLLKTEISYLQKELDEQLFLVSKMVKVASSIPEASRTKASDLQKSLERNQEVINQRLRAMPARVIFRSFDNWNNSLWINVGEANNLGQGTPVVALNSPVVVGCAIVGILDYIGKHQSRVRLISDNRLNPSVRVSRGGDQDFLLNEQIDHLLKQIKVKKQLPLSPNDQSQLIQILERLNQSLQPFKKTWYLAKGELLGSSTFSRFDQGIILKGSGFNYDFGDKEGESRDLRSGKSSLHPKEAAVPILKVNDILVTTGLDGIFPPHFQVAIVTHIELLKEGDYFYELEARPIAGPLEELSLVFVLPPINEEIPADSEKKNES